MLKSTYLVLNVFVKVYCTNVNLNDLTYTAWWCTRPLTTGLTDSCRVSRHVVSMVTRVRHRPLIGEIRSTADSI